MAAETFADQAITYLRTLEKPQNLPVGVDTLYPYDLNEVQEIIQKFYSKFYSDTRPRTFLIGINPGRLGAGITGIPFTDPVNLESELDIVNSFEKRRELSSRFVYKMISALGGASEFYSRFYITGVSPVGFVKEGINMNYYDDRDLQNSLEEYIRTEMEKQMSFGANPVAYSMGKGKNIAYLKKFNDKFRFFKEIRPLPHPRWVMQYRLKRIDEFIQVYKDELMPD